MIEREGASAPPAPQKLGDGLRNAADWIRDSVTYWADMLDRWQARPGEFIAYGELESNAIDVTPGGTPLIAYWKATPDEALIIRLSPPREAYWAIEFGSYWWETMDYRYRLCSVNRHHARLEENGTLLVVVSHRDPGLPNWLDPSGHEEGYVTYRRIGAEALPRPTVERVAVGELEAKLPANVRRITPAERVAQLRARRRGVVRRFGV